MSVYKDREYRKSKSESRKSRSDGDLFVSRLKEPMDFKDVSSQKDSSSSSSVGDLGSISCTSLAYEKPFKYSTILDQVDELLKNIKAKEGIDFEITAKSVRGPHRKSTLQRQTSISSDKSYKIGYDDQKRKTDLGKYERNAESGKSERGIDLRNHERNAAQKPQGKRESILKQSLGHNNERRKSKAEYKKQQEKRERSGSWDALSVSSEPAHTKHMTLI